MGASVGGAHHIVGCEVCKEPIRHGQTITVGRKDSGRLRVIHDRSKCRKKWAREKARLMARWPENRPAPKDAFAAAHQIPPVITSVLEAAKKDHRPASLIAEGKGVAIIIGEVEKPERPAPSLAARALGERITEQEKKEMGTLELVPQVRRSLVHYKPGLAEFITDWFKTREWKRGAAVVLHAVLKETHPDLLIGTTGREVTANHLSSYVPRVLLGGKVKAQPGGASAQEVESMLRNMDHVVEERIKVEKALLRAAECVSLGQAITNRVFAAVAAGEADMLRALAEMLAKEVKA